MVEICYKLWEYSLWIGLAFLGYTIFEWAINRYFN